MKQVLKLTWPHSGLDKAFISKYAFMFCIEVTQKHCQHFELDQITDNVIKKS